LMSAETKRVVKTGYNDRLYSLGVNQGALGGYKGDPYTWGGLPTVLTGAILPRRDDILIEEGGGGPRAIEQYTRLFNDSAVISAWEKLVGEIIQREWHVYPTSDSDKDEEVAEFVRQTLYHLGTNTRQSRGRDMLVSSNTGFNAFVKGMAESLILGMSVGEICWIRQGSYVVPSEIKIRDPRRFQFILNEDGSISPRIITIQSPVEGMPIPLRSMVIHRHWAYNNLADPYGTGLGRQLYSLVEFRRTLLSFWLQYADKHTTPTAVGKFSLGTPEEEVKSLFTALQRLGQETAIVVPDEMSIDYLTSDSRADVYQNLISYIDQQISFLINGEATVGAEGTGVGSYARDQIADSVRIRKSKSFSDQLDETINATLIRWIVELNYPGSSVPRISRDFSDIEQRGEDPIKTVQILTQLQAVGYQVTDLDWVRDKLRIPSLEKISMEEMMGGMGADAGMGEHRNSRNPQTANAGESNGPVIGESVIGKLLSSSPPPLSAENLDFSEFDESGDLKDETTRDKVAKKIAERFNQGGMDEVGWDRLSAGVSSTDSENSKINVDEYTTPGDIIYVTKRLLDEIRSVPRQIPYQHDTLRMDLARFENIVLRGDDLDTDSVENLVKLYSSAYRLNRSFVHRELVNIDPESLGYWADFAPYYM
jgi:phage gp29-like protein